MRKLGSLVTWGIALPLAGSLLLAGFLAAHWWSHFVRADVATVTASLEVAVSGAVTALQEERGSSSAVLSGASRFVDWLPAQRAATDVQVAQLHNEVVRARRGALHPQLDRVLSALERLPELRRRVDAGELGPLTNMQAYILLIDQLIGVVDAAHLDVGDPSLNGYMLAYARLAKFKEYAARERGLGASLLGAAEPAAALFEAYQESLAAQYLLMREFRAAAPDAPE